MAFITFNPFGLVSVVTSAVVFSLRRTMDVLISLNEGKTFISGAHTIAASACVRDTPCSFVLTRL